MRLDICNLTAGYRGSTAIANINAQLQGGEVVDVLGPNGAGKSTLLKAMLGLMPCLQGSTQLDGQPLHQQLRRVAYVPQRSAIDWDYPIAAWNVAMMGRTRQTGWLRPPSRQSREIVAAALDRMGMLALAQRPIGELSGGQQQRIFLARALAQEADAFCLDEPFVGVDKQTEAVIYALFAELKAAGKLLVVVSHDLSENLDHYDRFLLLNRQVIALGDRAQVFTPENLARAYGSQTAFAVCQAPCCN
ncbi:MAG: metal ABC transporter ATP-binding protein [Spirulinaceae cyanobacterium SM2_1_0]|nr:metal ABC transporter ATP-binding protein [Spirulinaceae cyanobacterium SM2_1_0]